MGYVSLRHDYVKDCEADMVLRNWPIYKIDSADCDHSVMQLQSEMLHMTVCLRSQLRRVVSFKVAHFVLGKHVIKSLNDPQDRGLAFAVENCLNA